MNNNYYSSTMNLTKYRLICKSCQLMAYGLARLRLIRSNLLLISQLMTILEAFRKAFVVTFAIGLIKGCFMDGPPPLPPEPPAPSPAPLCILTLPRRRINLFLKRSLPLPERTLPRRTGFAAPLGSLRVTIGIFFFPTLL